MSQSTLVKQTQSREIQFDVDKRKAIHLGTKKAGFIYVECAEDLGIRVSVCAPQCDFVTNRAKASHVLLK